MFVHQEVGTAGPGLHVVLLLAPPEVGHGVSRVGLGRGGPLSLQLIGPLALLRGGDGHRRHDLRVGVVRVEGERITPADVKTDDLAWADTLEHGDHVVVGEPQYALPVDVDQHVARPQLPVQPGGAVRHHGLDLQELLLAVVTAHYGEAQALRRLD